MLTDEQIAEFEAALVADGWSRKVDSNLCEYKRDGFVILVATLRHGLDISIWGDDSLAIEPPEVYSFDELKRLMTVCGECGVVGKTVRLGFAGRVCPDCRKRLAPTVEYPGWCN